MDITWEDLKRIFDSITVEPEPQNIPFPQADNMARIIDLLGQFNQNGGSLHKDEITKLQDFDARQSDYYANAGRYLGLIEKPQPAVYRLSTAGQRLVSLEQRESKMLLAKHILSRKVFYDSFAFFLAHNDTPLNLNWVIQRITQTSTDITESTLERRALTVLSWLNWILELPNR